MGKGGDPAGVHEPVKARDGFYFCRCGFRKERTYTKVAIERHIIAAAIRQRSKP